MSSRLSYAGGPLSFLLFAVLLFVATVLGFIIEVCESVRKRIVDALDKTGENSQ